tara:strand:- start:2412 stop:3056 length:645 start_codon:yes stop_codon:yes gene_type:complete
MTPAKTTTTKTKGPKLPSSSKSKAPAKKTPSKRTPAAPRIDSLPTNPFIHEVLDLASKQRSKAKKVEALQTYEHDSIKSVLIWNFNETVISLLPEGPVPYGDGEDQQLLNGSLSENLSREAAGGEAATRQDLQGQGRTSLRREWTKLYHFVKGGNDKLPGMRRENMFITILQQLHPREAEILVLVKDKKLTDKYDVTKEIVEEAYPDIEWGNRS